MAGKSRSKRGKRKQQSKQRYGYGLVAVPCNDPRCEVPHDGIVWGPPPAWVAGL